MCRCVAAKGEGAPECDKFAKYYRSLCPGEWVCILALDVVDYLLSTRDFLSNEIYLLTFLFANIRFPSVYGLIVFFWLKYFFRPYKYRIVQNPSLHNCWFFYSSQNLNVIFWLRCRFGYPNLTSEPRWEFFQTDVTDVKIPQFCRKNTIAHKSYNPIINQPIQT